MRMAAFGQVLRLSEIQNNITRAELRRGFTYEGQRIPLVNPQRGIFKPRQMRYLLSITTVYPSPGKRVWYDDQRQVHSQIFESREAVDYAFMGKNPDAADNRWLREAFENRVPVIYFLGVAPGLYQAIIPTYISGWDANALKARIVFGFRIKLTMLHQKVSANAVMRYIQSNNVFIKHLFAKPLLQLIMDVVPCLDCPSRDYLMQHTLSPTRMNSWANQLCQTDCRFQNPSRSIRCSSYRY